MLPLLLVVVLAQSGGTRRVGLSDSVLPDGRVRSGLRTGSTATVNADPGQFVLAPTNGAGMTAACACTAVTAAGGQSIGFSRASTAWCTKANQVTGILNGDLVLCGSGFPRVEMGGNGAETVLGVGFYQAATNTFLRSQEFDDGAWTRWGVGGASAPSVTANAAVAPDGTTSADQVDFGATTGAQRSALYQIPGITTDVSMSVYVKGVSGAGTIDLCTATVGLVTCTPCAFVNTSWTRCFHENKAVNAGTNSPTIGNNSYDNGGTARPAQSVYLWQADHHESLYGTGMGPPITTEGTTATRVVESGLFTPVSSVQTAGCTAATILAYASDAKGGIADQGGALRYMYTTAQEVRSYDSTSIPAAGGGTMSRTVSNRIKASWTGASLTVANVTAGTSTTGAFDGDFSTGAVTLGDNVSGVGSRNGIIKRFVFDSSPTVCQ